MEAKNKNKNAEYLFGNYLFAKKIKEMLRFILIFFFANWNAQCMLHSGKRK